MAWHVIWQEHYREEVAASVINTPWGGGDSVLQQLVKKHASQVLFVHVLRVRVCLCLCLCFWHAVVRALF